MREHAEAAQTELIGVTPTMRRRLVRLAFRFLWNRDDAEDAVQDALVSAHRQAGQLRDRNKLWPWLCRILVRRCIRRRRAPRLEFASQRIIRAGVPASEALSREQIKSLVQSSIAMLPRRQREVIVLRHLEGLSCETVAELLDISVSTVRVHAMAGRERLRELIKQAAPDVSLSTLAKESGAR